MNIHQQHCSMPSNYIIYSQVIEIEGTIIKLQLCFSRLATNNAELNTGFGHTFDCVAAFRNPHDFQLLLHKHLPSAHP